MKYIKYLFLSAIAVAVILLSLANGQTVTLTVLPEGLAAWVNWNAIIVLPLFVVILGGMVAGLLIGFIWEWFREYRQRAEAKSHRKERDQLAREVQSLRGDTRQSGDDVLALLEE